tara:strand:+ start:1108 stop:1452 length:345 start_codon:yes stop_codon:yes gene_type:complete
MLTNKNKFNIKYGFKRDEPHSKAELVKITGVPKRILDAVYDRGLGARRSNPESVRSVSDGKKRGGKSLQGKMSGNAWAMGRIYSFLTKQKGTWSGADKDLAEKVKKLKIKGFMR